MTIDKYRRVIWRLEEQSIIKDREVSSFSMRRAIMIEIGTDERTIENNINKMVELKYIKRESRWVYKLLVGSHDIC